MVKKISETAPPLTSPCSNYPSISNGDRFDQRPSFGVYPRTHPRQATPRLLEGIDAARGSAPQDSPPRRTNTSRRSKSNPGPTTVQLDEIRTLKRKVKDLEETNEILKAASIFFAGELDLATAGPVGANH